MPTLAGCSFSIDSILQTRPSPEKTSFLGPPQGSAKLGKLVGTSGCCMLLYKRLIVELISFSQRLVAGLGTCGLAVWNVGSPYDGNHHCFKNQRHAERCGSN